MDIWEISNSLDSITLPASQRRGLVQLIDAKINNDMKEYIAEIRRLEDKIQMVHDKLSNEIKIVYWVVGIAQAIMLFAMTIIARK